MGGLGTEEMLLFAFGDWRRLTRPKNNFFKMYTDYVANYNDALVKLEECRGANSKLDHWIKGAERKITNQLDLPSLLITPIQRIPRYNLLLRDLIKSTWEDHPDFESLTAASNAMSGASVSYGDGVGGADLTWFRRRVIRKR
jgi:hypothetical protein